MRQSRLPADPAAARHLGQRLFHGDHSFGAPRRNGGVKLMVVAFANQIPHASRRHKDFDGRITRAAGRGDQLLRHHRQQGER